MYNPKSNKSEEFINNEEIIKTLNWAKENKNNIDLINKIIDSARPVKRKHNNSARFRI